MGSHCFPLSLPLVGDLEWGGGALFSVVPSISRGPGVGGHCFLLSLPLVGDLEELRSE